MTLSLAQTQALSRLAGHLYDFLPGKAHPFADQSISFQGVATSLGLSQFWPGGSKLPAATHLLTETLKYQSNRFCPLLIEIVRKGIAYRQNKGNPITREEMDQLNDLIAQVGFKIPELLDRKFLESLPRKSSKHGASIPTEVPETKFLEFKNTLLKLASLSPQQRGFQFERLLTDLFEVFGLAPRGSFRIVGEQIDGSFAFRGETYLVEATWQNQRVGQEGLLTLWGKVSGKAEWSRGLFISYSGFTEEGLGAFAQGKRTNIICMDGLDLCQMLKARLDLRTVLERKARRAAETNEAFVSVAQLFPDIHS